MSEIVSILVLVEDALQDIALERLVQLEISFNPCFSGRCSASFSTEVIGIVSEVSILVLVEDALQEGIFYPLFGE